MRWMTFGIWLIFVAGAPARADVVTDWAEALLEAEPLASPPANVTRSGAILHVAMFEAVNAIERRYTAFREPLSFTAPASAEAAAAAAGHAVLSRLYPGRKETFDRRLAQTLFSIPEGPARANGIRLGEAAAMRELAAREGDRWTAASSYRPEAAPGRYVPTTLPGGSHLSQVTPWVMKSADQFRAPPPYPLESREWAQDFREVKELGAADSRSRTPDQTGAANFWDVSHQGMYVPPLVRIAKERQLPLADSARLLALFWVSAADTTIAVFDTKYHYGFWRPITAIRNADRDENADTERHPTWQPAITTPMHPEYPCMHCAMAALTATIVRAQFGNDPPAMRFTSPRVPDMVREFRDPADLVNEVIDVRVWGGVHYRASGIAGARIGRAVAEQVIGESMRAVP